MTASCDMGWFASYSFDLLSHKRNQSKVLKVENLLNVRFLIVYIYVNRNNKCQQLRGEKYSVMFYKVSEYLSVCRETK